MCWHSCLHGTLCAFEDVQEIDALVDYFERCTLKFRCGWRNPLFQLHIWNVYDHVQDHLRCINNPVEGLHHELQATLGRFNSRLIEVLKLEQSRTENKLVCLNASQPSKRQVCANVESSQDSSCGLSELTLRTICS